MISLTTRKFSKGGRNDWKLPSNPEVVNHSYLLTRFSWWWDWSFPWSEGEYQRRLTPCLELTSGFERWHRRIRQKTLPSRAKHAHGRHQSPSIAARLRYNRTASPYTSAPKHNYSAWKMTSFSTSSTRVQCAHVAKYSSHAFWLVIVRVVANTETGTVGGIAGIAGNLGNLLRLLYPYAKKSTRKFDYDWFSPGIFTQNLNQTIV